MDRLGWEDGRVGKEASQDEDEATTFPLLIDTKNSFPKLISAYPGTAFRKD
jgi:hypothetical protein